MSKRRNEWVGGLFLIGLGLLFLLYQFVDLPRVDNVAIYFMLGLGIVFLAWGALSREGGLLIPGGILTGIGLGIALVAGPYEFEDGTLSGGVFMGAFAFGWVLITIFTAIFTEKTQWWPLIPAAIMALIGGALLAQGPFLVALEWLGRLWPLALIIGGIAILLGGRRLSWAAAGSVIKSVRATLRLINRPSRS
jgi:hypothetical protein